MIENKKELLNLLIDDPLAIRKASDILKNDKEVALTAVRGDKNAFIFVSDKLKNDMEILNIILNDKIYNMGNVPLDVVSEVYGKNTCWVRAGIIAGWLPIGIATRDNKVVNDLKDMSSRYGRISYYVSPKLLYAHTGYMWRGEKNGK